MTGMRGRWERVSAVVASGVLAVGVLGVAAAAPVAAAGSPSATAIAAPVNAADVDLGNWMSEMDGVIGSRPLDSIAMPGSHDAGSWSIQDGSGVCSYGDNSTVSEDFPAVAASMSRTQSGSIVDQLNAGSRYLDLRLCDEDGLWHAYHGGPSGDLFFDADGQTGEADGIAAWIAAHPREVVVIQLTTAAAPAEAAADDAEAVNRLAQLIGTDALASTPQLTPQSTYDDYMAAARHVVLIDNAATVQTPWAWPGTVESDRGSYVASSPSWLDYLKSAVTGSSPQPLFDAAINLDQQTLAADPGTDAGKFFVLQGIIDPSLTIPGAAFAQLEAAIGVIPASRANSYLLYLEDQLNPQLLQKLRGDWSFPTLADHMNIVMTDDVDQNSGAMPIGTLAHAIIADNTPTIPAGTFYTTGRAPDGDWTAPQPLDGAHGAPSFGGPRAALAALPDGTVQAIGIGLDGSIYHNIRYTDGSWQGWVAVSGYNGAPAFSGPDCAITGLPDGDTQLAAIGVDGNVYHNIRYSDGSWQGWAPVAGSGGQDRFHATKVALAGLPDGSTQLVAYGTDGTLQLNTRAASGSWRGWSTVPGADGAAAFTGSALAVAAMPDGSTQILAVDEEGTVWHTVHGPDGSWQPWQGLPGPAGAPMKATSVAITGLPDGSSQILVVGDDGNTYHNVRSPQGTWQGFQPVSGIDGAPTLPSTTVAIAGLPDGSTQSLITTR